MELSATEARVLACLVEKEAAVPDSYPLTLNALRLACNQSTNRDPIVAYDDRTVDNALVSLKSMGLVRFMHPAHGGRTIRYRHVADERWRLSPAELGILSVLILRGPQTVNEIRTRAERHLEDGDATVDEVLDTLAARSPDPFVVRVGRRPGEREPALGPDHLRRSSRRGRRARVGDRRRVTATRFARAVGAPSPSYVDLARDVAELWARVERLERRLGLSEDVS